MIRKLAGIAAAWMVLTGTQAPPAAAPGLELWRLDCGSVEIGNLDMFSDTFLYVGRKKRLTDSCYLIRHGENYLGCRASLPARRFRPTAWS
jgi:N-acyl homoserine lactone hydrolase